MGNRSSASNSSTTDEGLRIAVRYGDVASAQMAILKGANPNTADPAGSGPLHIAALVGSVPITSMLLNAKAHVDGVNKDHRTALHCAAHAGHEKVCLALLEAGAKPDAVDNWGDQWTGLHYASRGGHLGVVDILLEAGARIDALTRIGQCTSLHEAARVGAIPVIRQLVREGANPDLRNGENKSFVECVEEREMRKEVQDMLADLSSDPEVMERRARLVKRPNSSLRKRNTAKRLNHKSSAQRVCGLATKMWAPPDFGFSGSCHVLGGNSVNGGARSAGAAGTLSEDQEFYVGTQPNPNPNPSGTQPNSTAPEHALHGEHDEEHQQHLVSPPARRDSLASLGQVSDSEGEESTAFLADDHTSRPAASSGCMPSKCAPSREDPTTDLVQVTLAHASMKVTRAYSKSQVKLSELNGDSSLIFGIDVKDVMILGPHNAVLGSSRELRDALQSVGDHPMLLRVEQKAGSSKSRLCECR
eukprot:TRINITY_DN5586_c0_g2_i1.p1 TRINITY_DN5586_c0_g2~~TRINITY_DN5586_c0_g2_i1.p1  ORF type:complete len:474 (-),score=87.94 TRINITY_DN5586_c0_g2_i1:347-1768(-)